MQASVFLCKTSEIRPAVVEGGGVSLIQAARRRLGCGHVCDRGIVTVTLFCVDGADSETVTEVSACPFSGCVVATILCVQLVVSHESLFA